MAGSGYAWAARSRAATIAPAEVRTGFGSGPPVMTWPSCSALQPVSIITVATLP
ncbi:hypothetical protein [Streptomyces sp. NPDC055299]